MNNVSGECFSRRRPNSSKAVEHFRRVEGELKIHPSIAVIQSWNQYPKKMTPETDPESLSFVVCEYSRAAKRN
jgi:hypothetical protein